MENRVYYGEYSLKHWIELMLTKNIELPDYQRHFVWQERDVKRLVKSLKEKQFVQPVTIALYNVRGEKRNLILDGQQRLTSILLTFLGYFPVKKSFLENVPTRLATEDDSSFDEEKTDEDITPILWKFSQLLDQKNSKEAIVARIEKDGRYYKLTDKEFVDVTADFFENTFIGFSYIVPEGASTVEVQNSFSKMFRNINYFGKKLDPMESRKSLYFQNSDLINFFEGKTEKNEDVLCGINIVENLQPCKIDFVRYLSLLSQYFANDKNVQSVLVGYSVLSSRESFYADYVSYVLGQGADEQESRPDKFDKFDFSHVFPKDSWSKRFQVLKETVERLKPLMALNDKDSFGTWIEADYWLFGLIYYIVFEGKVLNETLSRPWRRPNVTISLNDEINKIITTTKGTDYYLKNTNRLGNLRARIEESCKIFEKYVH